MGGGYCLTRQLGNLRYLGCQPKVILCTLTLCYNNNNLTFDKIKHGIGMATLST